MRCTWVTGNLIEVQFYWENDKTIYTDIILYLVFNTLYLQNKHCNSSSFFLQFWRELVIVLLGKSIKKPESQKISNTNVLKAIL